MVLHSSTVWSSGYRLCGDLHVLSVFVWVSFAYSNFQIWGLKENITIKIRVEEWSKGMLMEQRLQF